MKSIWAHGQVGGCVFVFFAVFTLSVLRDLRFKTIKMYWQSVIFGFWGISFWSQCQDMFSEMFQEVSLIQCYQPLPGQRMFACLLNKARIPKLTEQFRHKWYWQLEEYLKNNGNLKWHLPCSPFLHQFFILFFLQLNLTYMKRILHLVSVKKNHF